MAKINIDTDKVKELTRELQNIVNDYENSVDNLFNEINNLSNIWRGPDSETFIKSCINEKKEYENIANISNQYINQINSIIELFEN